MATRIVSGLRGTEAGNGSAGASLKARLVERWVARRLGSVGHERRVLRIAQILFELTAPLHDLSAYERRMLELSCLVHDIGRSIDDDEHPAEGARMVMQDGWLPLNNTERRALAYLTLHHRGAVPEIGKDDILQDGDGRRALRTTLALLRAADALDCRSLDSPRLVFALHGRRLVVTCYLEEDSAKARKVYRRRKKFRLLEELLDVRVEVDVRTADVLHMVA